MKLLVGFLLASSVPALAQDVVQGPTPTPEQGPPDALPSEPPVGIDVGPAPGFEQGPPQSSPLLPREPGGQAFPVPFQGPPESMPVVPRQPGAAQGVQISGTVIEMGSLFFLECTDVQLSSTTVDLSQFSGMEVSIRGSWNGSLDDPQVDVELIQESPGMLDLTGSGAIGEPAQLAVTAPVGSTVFGFVTTESSLMGFGPSGTSFLGATPIGVGGDTVPNQGILFLNFRIPNDPRLIGVEFLAQAVVGDSVTGNFHFTNPVCLTITG